MRNVKPVKAKGRTYYYHRPTGKKLPGEPGSPEFQAEYDRLEGVAVAVQEARIPTTARTVGELFAAYRGSPAFLDKAEATKADYMEAMDWMKALHDIPLDAIDTPFLTHLRDQAFATRKRWFANHLIRFLSALFNWGRPYGHMASNPAEAVPKIRRPRGAPVVNRPWSPVELKKVMEAMPPELRVAVALGAYAGLREGDAIRLTWSAYDGEVIESRQLKTGDPIWVPTHRELRRILDEARAGLPELAARLAKRNKPVPLTIVAGQRGQPFTETGFRARFFKVIRQLVADGEVAPGLTYHGLRHTAATMLADAGCDTRDIMAITGHKTEAMARRYTEHADQRRRATVAIAKLEAFTNPPPRKDGNAS